MESAAAVSGDRAHAEHSRRSTFRRDGRGNCRDPRDMTSTRRAKELGVVTEQDRSRNNVVDITIALINYNTAFLLDRLFSALAAAQGRLKLQIIVVDNVSRDDSLEILRSKYPFAEVIRNTINVGFGRANNQ